MAVRNRLVALMGEKQAKENRAINLSDIARETGISRQQLHLWKSNKIGRFDGETIEALCQYFNCSVGDLLYIERTPEASPN